MGKGGLACVYSPIQQQLPSMPLCWLVNASTHLQIYESNVIKSFQEIYKKNWCRYPKCIEKEITFSRIQKVVKTSNDPKIYAKEARGTQKVLQHKTKVPVCSVSFNMNAHVPNLFGKTSQLLAGLILFYGITCQNVGGYVGTLCALKKLNANASYSYCSWQDR